MTEDHQPEKHIPKLPGCGYSGKPTGEPLLRDPEILSLVRKVITGRAGNSDPLEDNLGRTESDRRLIDMAQIIPAKDVLKTLRRHEFDKTVDEACQKIQFDFGIRPDQEALKQTIKDATGRGSIACSWLRKLRRLGRGRPPGKIKQREKEKREGGVLPGGVSSEDGKLSKLRSGSF